MESDEMHASGEMLTYRVVAVPVFSLSCGNHTGSVVLVVILTSLGTQKRT